MILQADNGKEFNHGAAKSWHVQLDDEVSKCLCQYFIGTVFDKMLMLLKSQFFAEVISQIKKLWPRRVLVTGKPCHSESTGGVERQNRTVEEKQSNWIHGNHLSHWARALPFKQWHCNTQSQRGIGDRTPYHLTFGQHPHVGISNLPIDPNLLSSLATDMDICHSLGLPNMPLECVNLVSSLGADASFKNPLQKINSPEETETPMIFLLQNSLPFPPRKRPMRRRSNQSGGLEVRTCLGTSN